MRWDRLTPTEKETLYQEAVRAKRRAERKWHSKFVWFPTRLVDHRFDQTSSVVWLETVARIDSSDPRDFPDSSPREWKYGPLAFLLTQPQSPYYRNSDDNRAARASMTISPEFAASLHAQQQAAKAALHGKTDKLASPKRNYPWE